MTKIVWFDLRVKVGGIVSVHLCPTVKHGEQVHILSIIEDVTSSLLNATLKPHFGGSYMLVRKGDLFLVMGGMHSFESKQWDPGKCVSRSNFYNLEDKVDLDGVGNDTTQIMAAITNGTTASIGQIERPKRTIVKPSR